MPKKIYQKTYKKPKCPVCNTRMEINYNWSNSKINEFECIKCDRIYDEQFKFLGFSHLKIRADLMRNRLRTLL